MPEVDPNDVLRAMATAGLDETEEIPDPRLKIDSITTNGTVVLKFN